MVCSIFFNFIWRKILHISDHQIGYKNRYVTEFSVLLSIENEISFAHKWGYLFNADNIFSICI